MGRGSSIPPARLTPPPEMVTGVQAVEVERPQQDPMQDSDEPLTITESPAEAVRLRQLCSSFLEAPDDIQRLRALRSATTTTRDEIAAAGVTSFLALFEGKDVVRPIGDGRSLGRFTNDLIRQMASLPRQPELQALAKLWRAAPQLLSKDLNELGVSRALPPPPGGATPAEDAFAAASRLVGSETGRLLNLPAGPVVRLVLTRPPSLLVGPGGREDTPELRYRVARGVAMGHIELLLPCVLGADELHTLLMALQAAYGESPPRGSLDFAAASLAQDLWSAVPRSAQQSLRQLIGQRPPPEVDALRERAMRSATLLALLITGDAATAIRVMVADDPFLSGTDPSTDEGFVRVIRSSPNVRAVIRLALSPRYWEVRLSI